MEDNDQFFHLIEDIAEKDKLTLTKLNSVRKSIADFYAWKELAHRLFELEYYDIARICYDKAYILNSGDFDLCYQRGLAYVNLGMYEEGIRSFDQAIKLNPRNTDAWSAKGNALNNSGKFRDAIKAYDRAFEINPNHLTAWFNKGSALMNLGRYEEAIKSYDKVIELDEKNTDALNAKGLALDRLGDYAGAIKCYDAVLDYDELSTDAMNSKGLALQRMGKIEAAMQCYKNVTELYKRQVEDYMKSADRLVKHTEDSIPEINNLRDAIKAYDKVIKINPNHLTAWFNKGSALMNLGRYEEAIKSYDKVIELDEKNTDALNAKGLVLEKQGRYSEAVSCYDNARRIKPDNSSTLYNKAKLSLLLGNLDYKRNQEQKALDKYHEAVKLVNELIDFDPNNILALELLRELYSNYTFEFALALNTVTKLFNIVPSDKNKLKLAEDFVKVGNLKKGRELAVELKKDIPWTDVILSSILRVVLSSCYLFEGNYEKGNKEIFELLKYIQVLKDFRVEEEEWNFNGLLKAIDQQVRKSDTKLILTNLINLLTGKGIREQILAQLFTAVSDTSLEISHQARRKFRILIPIIIVGAMSAIVIAVITSFLFMETQASAQCYTDDGTSVFSGSEKIVPGDIAVNPDKHIVYVAEPEKKEIIALDCSNTRVLDRINTTGPAVQLLFDPRKNILYADLQAENRTTAETGTTAVAIDTNTFGVTSFWEYIGATSFWEYIVNTYIRPIFPSSGEFTEGNHITSINTSEGSFDSNFKSDDWQPYLLGPNQSHAIYKVGSVGSDLRAYPISNATTMPRPFANSTIIQDILAFNPETNKIYLGDRESGSVSLIDLINNKSTPIVGPGNSLNQIDSIAVNPNKNKIYVTQPNLQNVLVINGENNSIKNIPVGRFPTDIFVDEKNNMVYVANQLSNAVSVIDSNRDQVVKVLYVPADWGSLTSVSVDPKTGKAYAGISDLTRGGNRTNGDIQMVNPNAKTESTYIQVGPVPAYLDYLSASPNVSKVYVAKINPKFLNSSISVINTTSNTVIKDIVLAKGLQPFKLAVDPENMKVYVANSESNIISVINASSDTILNNIPLPPGMAVADISVNQNNSRVYAISDKNASLYAIDGISNNISNSLPLPFSPSTLAVNPDRSKIYLANYDNWSINVIDDSRNDLVLNKVIDLAIPPQSITYDTHENKIYASSYSREDASKGENINSDAMSALYPPRTQVQIIDGIKDTIIFKGNDTLKLAPKYGDVILASNPTNGDILAISPSTGKILSWSQTQAVDMLKEGGVISDVKETDAGIQPADIAIDSKGGGIYIINPTLNAVMMMNSNRTTS